MNRIHTLGLAFAFAVATAGTAAAQVKLGVEGPITGPNAAFGAQLKNGAEQAVADLNAKGGILGNKISISFGDDVSDPKQGVSVANKFVADGVKFVVGAFNSGVTMPSSEVYQENGIVEITPASTNPQITERGMWNIFRTCGRDDQQGAVAGAYILKHFKGKKIAVVHDKTTYGKGLADETVKALAKGNMKPVLYEGVNTGEKDFSALVSKIKQSGADLVYWGGLHTEGGLIIRQMHDQGIKAPLMGGDGITTDELASIGGPAVEGTLMTYGPDARKNPAAKAAVAQFRAKKFEPEAYTLYSYAAVQIFAQAATAAKSTDPKKVAEKMHSGMKFNTVIGPISYDKKGDRTGLDYVMYIWKKNKDGKITYEECPAAGCK
ncbi:MAG TPA: branched-chain amino acid ABC transporter substrate-binding protein [Pseudolabrys sp.]|nr:branched-chain amino acid ABC transporter substrate-binding protein [Pseudolabrys sp.]